MTMSLDARTDLLLSDPAGLANQSLYEWEHMPRAEVDALQLAGLQRRFSELRDQIPVLKKLADGDDIEHIDDVEDVLPLLFEHTVYKSYPPALLEGNRFTQINRWLGRLVLPEVAEALAAADVAGCQGLDDYFAAIDRQVPALRLGHSSGTSGTISFLPHSHVEADKHAQVRRLHVWNMTGPDTPQPELYVAYPYFRYGYASQSRSNDSTVKHLLRGEEYFHAAYPGVLSSDMIYLGARIRAAQTKGTLDRLQISPAMLARKQQHDQLLADMPAHLERFFEKVAQELNGKRIFVWGTWNLLHNMAKAGLARGLEGVFAPESYINTGGGAKGLVQPEGWQDDLLRFTGAKRLYELYAMTEILAAHFRCEHGNYHLGHTAIPYLLDPETSKPLPRAGRQTGRAAFYDLGANARWGGFITGDEITIEWDEPCVCGRTSRYVTGPISRYSEQQGGDDKITCAATEETHRGAMDFLNTIEA